LVPSPIRLHVAGHPPVFGEFSAGRIAGGGRCKRMTRDIPEFLFAIQTKQILPIDNREEYCFCQVAWLCADIPASGDAALLLNRI
jgi:hypothetical protein